MREVRDHEPEIALYGGEEGYEFYADLIAQAAQQLGQIQSGMRRNVLRPLSLDAFALALEKGSP